VSLKEVISRRELLSGSVIKGLMTDWLTKAPREEVIKDSMVKYFQSPMYSYPLLQEMPWSMLVEEAQRHDIAVEGRTKNDIARDLFLDDNSKEL
jgi:hypothetical protein